MDGRGDSARTPSPSPTHPWMDGWGWADDDVSGRSAPTFSRWGGDLDADERRFFLGLHDAHLRRARHLRPWTRTSPHCCCRTDVDDAHPWSSSISWSRVCGPVGERREEQQLPERRLRHVAVAVGVEGPEPVPHA